MSHRDHGIDVLVGHADLDALWIGLSMTTSVKHLMFDEMNEKACEFHRPDFRGPVEHGCHEAAGPRPDAQQKKILFLYTFDAALQAMPRWQQSS
jgi:hypothetical protein